MTLAGVTYRLLYPCPLYCVYVYYSNYSNQHYRALEAFLSIYTLSDENQTLHPEMVLYPTYSVYSSISSGQPKSCSHHPVEGTSR